MVEPMKVFKLVRQMSPEGLRKSAIITRGVHIKTYTPGKKVFAGPTAIKNGYGLLAFENEYYARDFPGTPSVGLTVYPRFEIWEAEGYEQMPLPIKTWTLGYLHPRFWVMIKELGDRMMSLGMGTWPEGTVMFKAIKLIRLTEPVLEYAV